MSSLAEFTEVAESVSDDDDEVEFGVAAAVATEMTSAEEGPMSPPFDGVTFESDARQ